MNKRQLLGQFNTTRKDYILSGFEDIFIGKVVIDPFAGVGDLLDWARNHGAVGIKGYDIDTSLVQYQEPSNFYTIRDTLSSPPDYRNYWVIANPPYLARNRNKNKNIYDLYGLDDLYKCAIKSVFGCRGGIFIVPINFLSSENAVEIRRQFFTQYDITGCKIFEEKVFDDTDYTVCAFSFVKSEYRSTRMIYATFMPSGRIYPLQISEKYGWICGEEFWNYIDRPVPKYIGRYIKPDDNIDKNIILLHATDTGTQDGKIKLLDIREKNEHLIGKQSSRTFAHLKFDNPPSIEKQLEIIHKFNEKLNFFREKYNSIFLTAYRNSTKYSRKRIGFDIVYKMIDTILSSC